MGLVLVVGGTGGLGRPTVSLLRDAGSRVRVLVRPSKSGEVIDGFASAGIEIAHGDLKDLPSLAAACDGVDTVVSTATSAGNRLDGDSIETVDHAGTLALVAAAEAAKVAHFVYVSFADIEVEFPLKSAKKAIQDRLKASGTMASTVLKPTYFMETWLPMLFTRKVDPATNKEAFSVFGTGRNPVSWISRTDVARYIVRAVTQPGARGVVAELGGPEAVSQLAALELFTGAAEHGLPIAMSPEADLKGGAEGAPDPLMRSFCALMLGIARGLVVLPTREPSLALSSPLGSVREFVEAFAKAQPRTQAA
jgi:uncharacterized protein YbjT (DUF2867 family)